MKWWKRFKAWKYFRLALITLSICTIIFILTFLFELRFLVVDDLSIAMSPVQSKIITQNSTLQVDFTVNTNAFSLCRSECIFTFTDMATEAQNTTERTLQAGKQAAFQYTIDGLSGFEERLYSFEVECSNVKRVGCKQSTPRYRSALVSVTKHYDEEELTQKELAESVLLRNHNRLQEQSSAQDYYTLLLDTISTSVVSHLQVLDELEESQLQVQAQQEAYQAQQFTNVHSVNIPNVSLETEKLLDYISQYNTKRQYLRDLANSTYLEAYEFFAKTQDSRAESMRLEYEFLGDADSLSFEELLLADIERSYDIITRLVTPARKEQREFEQDMVLGQAQQEKILERLGAVSLRGELCTDQVLLNTLTGEHNNQVLSTPPEYENQVSFIRKHLLTVDENTTHLITENASIVKELSMREYLVYVKFPSLDTRYCQEFTALNYSFGSMGLIDIPVFSPQNKSILITEPQQRCCLYGVCSLCAQKEFAPPVLFIHGHSFNKDNPPEASIQAFSSIQHALAINHSIINGGDIDYSTSRLGLLSHMPLPLGLRGTYYTIAYYDAESLSTSIRKEEGIEVYSLRLKELIDVTLEQTGAQKVTVVAHSMGGLVVRNYLLLFGEDKVDKVILIATPNAGITGRVQQLCDTFGETKTCSELQQGSVLLKRINNYTPKVPVYLIMGRGCSTDGEDGDGIVQLNASLVSYAHETVLIDGTCTDVLGTNLHNELLNVEAYPQVVDALTRILNVPS